MHRGTRTSNAHAIAPFRILLAESYVRRFPESPLPQMNRRSTDEIYIDHTSKFKTLQLEARKSFSLAFDVSHLRLLIFVFLSHPLVLIQISGIFYSPCP